eukprot:CAMPEP_0182423638 /NCGR_PEP_ID=MMETSP1167-20130531/9711_1 /TAXON_ID=2988 /ORGANISM="Mallomonas Sp, Strain CCMP3275" /LENGTH=330 /DNA_ID=CAMNT_0024602809 /DNA_START=71 /DNA_END=1063 /DNA_ORIENTATION=-
MELKEGESPIQFCDNYTKFSKLIGLVPNTKVVHTLREEDPEKIPIEQLVIDDSEGPLGPGGTRALMTALMGSGPSMKGGPYKLLKYIRIWRSQIGDDGAAAIAEVLRLGGADVQIQYLELTDNHIAARGALALGTSLSKGHNLSLLTLKLDYNITLGTDGVINLCRGLRTNGTLKQLHLCYCDINHEAGSALSDVLENTRSALEWLNLSGNRLGGIGLLALCKGLSLNTKCTHLLLADNMIDQSEDDVKALEAFRDCLMTPSLALTHVDLMYNRIGPVGAQVLVLAVGPDNERLEDFLVDLTIPLPLFEQLFRKGAGKKSKKKKSTKKKK